MTNGLPGGSPRKNRAFRSTVELDAVAGVIAFELAALDRT
jgi:hypothetical protein